MKRIIICPDCGQEKEHSAKGLCEKCYTRRWRKKNRQRLSQYNHQWRAEHPEQVKIYRERYRKSGKKATDRVRWYQKHRERCLAYMREYNYKHRVRRRAYQQQYHKEHPEQNQIWKEQNRERCTAIQARRRARKRNLPSTLTSEQRKAKLAIGHCFYCGGTGDLEIDHFIPLVGRGGTTLANSVVACRKCNLQKHAQLPEELIIQMELC